MFATLAASAGTPTASKAGYEMSEVMPPAVPTMPDSIPAAAMSIASGAEIMRLVNRDERSRLTATG